MAWKGTEIGISPGLVGGGEVDGRLLAWIDDVGIADHIIALRDVVPQNASGSLTKPFVSSPILASVPGRINAHLWGTTSDWRRPP